MKLTGILLLVLSLQVSAEGLGQQVTFTGKRVSLKKVFSEIIRQTGVTIIYNENLIKKAAPVDIDVKDANIEEVMALCLKGMPFKFTMEGSVISIDPTESLNPQFSNDFSRRNSRPVLDLNPPVKARVVAEDGTPLAGASVIIKGKKTSTTTDADGFFLLNADENETIIVSFIGYSERQIRISSSIEIIMLEKSRSKLDEVQVVAYGTNTQRYQTGSITKITSKEIEDQPVANVLATLAARVPGLIVSQSGGSPGASFQVQIRGQNTLSKQPPGIFSYPSTPDNPFFVIDGVPFATQNNNINTWRSSVSPGSSGLYANPHGGLSPFSIINPQDIESIEVLRDADATAIYGSRAANGVILITTKKGRNGKTVLNANVYKGFSKVTRTLEMMNTEDYRAMRKEAIVNDGLQDLINEPTLANYFADVILWDSTRNIDWKKYFIGGTAKTLDANVSLSGGSNQTQFFISGGYYNEGNVFPGNYGFKRGTITTNIHHTTNNKRFNINLSASYGFGENNTSGNADGNTVFALPPNHPDFIDERGNLIWSYKGIDFLYKPLTYLKQEYEMKNNNLQASLSVDYKLAAGLVLRGLFGFNNNISKEWSGVPIAAFNPKENKNGEARFGNSTASTWNFDPTLEYTKQIKSVAINVLLGSSFQRATYEAYQFYVENYSNDLLLRSILDGTISNRNEKISLYKYSAGFGRISLRLKNKYIINLNGRRDGSSRFGPGRQFGNFGSAAGAWIYTEERGIKGILPWLSYGKLRVSYGTVGSDNGSDYEYLSNWSPLPYTYQNSGGAYTPRNIFNAEFNWTLTRKWDVGSEMGFFADKLLIGINWYRNRTGNQLVDYALPAQSGFPTVKKNQEAVVENKGIEFQLNSTNVKSKNFKWSTFITLSINRNKLVAYPGLESSSYAQSYKIGSSLSRLNVYNYRGVNDTTGNFEFYDANGKPTYNPDLTKDFVDAGELYPRFTGGVGNSLSFKGFTLDIVADFRKQRGPNYLGQISSGSFPVGGQKNVPAALKNAWHKIGDAAIFSKYSMINYNPYFFASTGAYSDASFIRIKTISLSYNLYPSLIRKAQLSNCRIYVNTQNLFTITNYLGNDPENMSFYSIPPLRTIVMGLQLSL